jgi:hypothetical protein
MVEQDIDIIFIEDGGPGSGDFGHAGRPGKVGGSAKGGSKNIVKASAPEKKEQAHERVEQPSVSTSSEITAEYPKTAQGQYVKKQVTEFTKKYQSNLKEVKFISAGEMSRKFGKDVYANYDTKTDTMYIPKTGTTDKSFFKHAVKHELTHSQPYNNKDFNEKQKEWFKRYIQQAKKDPGSVFSQYGTKDRHEGAAEAVSMVSLGLTNDPMAKEMAKLYDEYFRR